MGALSLWHLARRGISAIGIEQFGVPHDRGAHGAETRIFRTAYKEGSVYVPLLRDALRGWRQLEGETSRKLLTLTGGLSIGDPRSEWMQAVLASITAFDLEHELLDATEGSRRFPQHRLLPDDGIIVDKKAGFLRPEFAVAAATERAERLGAVVLRHTRVQAVEPDQGIVRVRTDSSTLTVRKVVVTTGPWAAKLLPDLAQRITVHRLVSTWFLASDPAIYDSDAFPVFIRQSEGMEHSISGVPSVDGGGVKVMLNKHFGVYDPDQLDHNLGYQELETIRTEVRECLPGLNPDAIRVGVYMDGYTPDEHAIVGLHASCPNIVLMVGFSGHGFKLAPVMGEIAADLLTNGATRHRIQHLLPSRFDRLAPGRALVRA